MTANLNELRSRLYLVKNEKCVDDTGVEPYLIEHLLYPVLNGEAIMLNSLDYDAFDLNDIERLDEYVSDLMDVHYKVSQIPERLQKAVPLAHTIRRFC